MAEGNETIELQEPDGSKLPVKESGLLLEVGTQLVGTVAREACGSACAMIGALDFNHETAAPLSPRRWTDSMRRSRWNPSATRGTTPTSRRTSMRGSSCSA